MIAALLGIVSCVAATVSVWDEPPGDPRQVIQETEAFIAEFGRTIQPPPTTNGQAHKDAIFAQEARKQAWTEFKSKCYRLSYLNGQTARARAMNYLSTNPEQYSTYEWGEHQRQARSEWIYFETSDRILNTSFACIVSLLAATLAAWLTGLLISWLWYFSLDRLKEISHAIRGTDNDRNV